MAISHIIYFFMYRNHYKGDCNRRQCIEHYYHLSTHAWIFPFFSCHDSKWRNKITIDCIKKKARESVLSLVPRFEAFALPCSPNEQRRSPRRYALTQFSSPKGLKIVNIYISRRHLQLLYSLTTKSCEVFESQRTKRHVNAFLMYVKPTHPSNRTSA